MFFKKEPFYSVISYIHPIRLTFNIYVCLNYSPTVMIVNWTLVNIRETVASVTLLSLLM